jgi:hypothetical protein
MNPSQLSAFFIVLLLTCCTSVQDCPEKINLLPMYGKQQKCAEQLYADQSFLKEMDSIFWERVLGK